MHTPWGTPQTEPVACPRVCTIPTMELEKAMPARVAALAMARRPSRSDGFRTTLRRFPLMSPIADRAVTSLRGFLLRQ